MPKSIWMNGTLVPAAQATVSVYDHGLLYGDGCFEGLRMYSGKIFECEAHVKRLFESARAIRLEIPFTPQQLTIAMYETCSDNGFQDCYLRLVVTRGSGALGISPVGCKQPGVFIIADLISMYPLEMYEKGMAIITSSVMRNHPAALSPRIKSLNYLNNVLAKIEAIDAGVPEAIMLNHQGRVAECTADNIFLIKNGALSTPMATEGALEGITRNFILKLAREMSIPAREVLMEKHDVYVADECFLTGTGAEVIPVTMVDKRPIGDGTVGPMTKQLIKGFREAIRK